MRWPWQKPKTRNVFEAQPVYAFNHILYLNMGIPLCYQPHLLGTDFVITDTKQDRPHCPFCLPLLVAHNEKAAADEREARR